VSHLAVGAVVNEILLCGGYVDLKPNTCTDSVSMTLSTSRLWA